MSLTIIKTKPVERSLSTRRASKRVEPIMWLAPSELAEHFRVSTTTIWRWRKRNINPLPAHKNVSVVRFDLAECDAWYKGEYDDYVKQR